MSQNIALQKMQVEELYVPELCYLCQIISTEMNQLIQAGYKEIVKSTRISTFMPWRRRKTMYELNQKLELINENLRFRRELLEKLHNSTGGGAGEKLTLLEILQRGGSLI